MFEQEVRVKIYVLKEGLRYGPYSVGELRQQLDAGMFKPESFASVDGCHSWTPIHRLSAIAPQLFKVEVDKGRNLLVIRYRGRVGRDAVEQCSHEIRRALAQLERGFQLLADFTELEEMDVSCASVVAEIMDLCNEAGVATVVRVIPEPRQDIGLQIMSFFHYGNNVCIATCTSMDEALKLLSHDDYEKPEEIASITMTETHRVIFEGEGRRPGPVRPSTA
jgi:anti-anti-sigma regulatory factor